MCRQKLLSETLGSAGIPAPQLVRDLVSTLPGVAKDHDDAEVDVESLGDFAEWLFDEHGAKLNALSPLPFGSANDVHRMLAHPLAKL